MKSATIVLLTLCLLLGGCKVLTEQSIPQDSSTEQHQQIPPDTDNLVPPGMDYPVPPETPPPAGTDSDAPPPAEGPEGLPTPAL